MGFRLERLVVSGRAYLRVVEDVKHPGVGWTTSTIRAFGPDTPESRREAEELLRDLKVHQLDQDAPELTLEGAELRSLRRGPVLGLVSPENTPNLWYGLYALANAFIKQNISTEEGLRRMIEMTQPDLRTDRERDRFLRWLRDKPDGEKERILIKRWHYSESRT